MRSLLRLAGELEGLRVRITDKVVERLDLRQALEPSAGLVEPTGADVELRELLDGVGLAGVNLQRRLEVAGGPLDVAALEGVPAQAHHRRGVPGIATEVGAVFHLGLVEPAVLGELLGEAQPGLVEVGVAFQRRPVVPDHLGGLGIGPGADLVAPQVRLGVRGHQLPVALDHLGRLGQPIGRQVDAGQLAGDLGARLSILGVRPAQHGLGVADAAGTGLIDALQDLQRGPVEAQLLRPPGGLGDLGRAIVHQGQPGPVIVGLGRARAPIEPEPQGFSGRLVATLRERTPRRIGQARGAIPVVAEIPGGRRDRQDEDRRRRPSEAAAHPAPDASQGLGHAPPSPLRRDGHRSSARVRVVAKSTVDGLIVIAVGRGEVGHVATSVARRLGLDDRPRREPARGEADPRPVRGARSTEGAGGRRRRRVDADEDAGGRQRERVGVGRRDDSGRRQVRGSAGPTWMMGQRVRRRAELLDLAVGVDHDAEEVLPRAGRQRDRRPGEGDGVDSAGWRSG